MPTDCAGNQRPSLFLSHAFCEYNDWIFTPEFTDFRPHTTGFLISPTNIGAMFDAGFP